MDKVKVTNFQIPLRPVGYQNTCQSIFKLNFKMVQKLSFTRNYTKILRQI